MRRAVFLDRDGVLNPAINDHGHMRAPKSLAEFKFLPGVKEALDRLAAAGFALVVITNQPGVERGVEQRSDVEAIHRYLADVTPIEAVYVCWHDDKDHCECRKPKPEMFLEAARELDVDLGRSVSVGDHWVDVAAGQAAGCFGNLLILHASSEEERCKPDAMVADLSQAANWILQFAPK
jgi:D-glycero-D-manno-heptose 1,7-bisphosphate phosphatase